MAAGLNFYRFIRDPKKFAPLLTSLNRPRISVKNRAFIHLFCPATYKESLPTVPTHSPQDILLSKLRSALDTWEVLEAVSQHHSIMNVGHTLQGLRSIFLLQKSQSNCISNGEVINNPQFRLLVNTLKSQIRHLDVNELLDTLKYLGYLGVPATSKIMQLLMQLLSKHVNQLSLQQITFLDFIMKDFTSTPLVKALNIALPIVFEANLLTMCDFNNVNQLCELLIFVSKRPVHDKCARIILDALTQQRKNIDLKLAKSIIRSFFDLQRNSETDKLLLHHSLDVITDSIDDLMFYEMETILTRILTKYTEGYSHFYHEEYINACANYIINKNCGFEKGLWVLRKISRFNHVHLPLLDYLTDKVQEQPWVLEQGPAGMLIGLVSGLAQADYKPEGWEKIKNLVTSCAEIHKDRQELPWMKLVVNLCVMDCWSLPLFNKVFDEQFLDKYLSRDYNTLDKLQLLLLHQFVSTLAPWSDGPSVPDKYLTSAIEINGTHHMQFPLHQALIHGLGDQSYVLSSVYTKLGHFLDHVIVMRKGGYPVAINLQESLNNNERTYVEDLDLPPDCKKVAILLVTPTMSSINNERVRGVWRLQINTIECLGITVVPVLQTVWQNIADTEKIPYLMQAIQQKLQENEKTSVVVPV